LNLRPSGYEPDELPGCSIPRQSAFLIFLELGSIVREIQTVRADDRTNRGFFRFGSDLLSHALRRSTIGATVLNCRVRDGTGCFTCAMTTKPKKSSVTTLRVQSTCNASGKQRLLHCKSCVPIQICPSQLRLCVCCSVCF
jgi:hypothetical protein